MLGIARSRSEKRITLPPNRWNRITSFHLPSKRRSAASTSAAAELGNLDPHHLGVIGRTSAMDYKGSKRSISEIGKDLSVAYARDRLLRASQTVRQPLAVHDLAA